MKRCNNNLFISLFKNKSALLALMLLTMAKAHAQQFSSDSWLSKKHGTITLIATTGERSTNLMNTYSLFPKWEFTMAAYLYNDDNDPLTDDGYSASLYVKYMFYQNTAETGGAAVKLGTGMFPGYLDNEGRVKDAFKTYWTNVPITFPFLKNTLPVDVMPGASATVDYGTDNQTEWAFTYATRIAWYPIGPEYSIVAEVFGSMAEGETAPEFKTGLRWEPSQYAVIALTYGNEFSGSEGAGFEIGIMLFTPPFACFGNCMKEKKTR